MIRRLLERWLGMDRLERAYAVRCAELYEARQRNEAQAVTIDRLRDRYAKLRVTHQGTVQRLSRQRTQLNRMTNAHTRALVELQWARFQLDQNGGTSADCTKMIKLITSDHAWEVADILAKRFGYPMYAHDCPKCPVNPVTRGRYWHVTKKPNPRPV